jgi:hypothetical protein
MSKQTTEQLAGLIAAVATGGPQPNVLPKDKANGLGISTINSQDMGYETAILDAKNAHPVERYETEDEAKAGHAKWLKRVQEGLSEVTRLGYGDIVDDEQITLVPYDDEDDEIYAAL